MNPVKRFALAASYVTRLPLSRLPEGADGIELSGLSKYLPAVGLMVGTLLLGLAWLLERLQCDHLVSGAVLTVSWLVITGGIHFDGLMDTADGVFSHRSPERMLEIMSDSRVGNFGAMTGWCVLLLKFVSLSALPAAALLPVLLLVPAWARWCETYAIGAFPYLREAGMGKVWHDTTRFPIDVYVAAVLPLAAAVCLQHWCSAGSALIAVSTVLAGLAASYYLAGVLKGHTGDTYGAVVELAETGGLLIAALLSQYIF